MSLESLRLRDRLLELAERYETVVALDLTQGDAPAGRSKPGSRVPPGAQEILDADEIERAVTAVDEWAEFLAHVIADECEVQMPDGTAARLRKVAEHAEHLASHDDELLALSVEDDLHERLRDLRPLSRRGVRKVQTGVRCQEYGCRGRLISPLGNSPDRHDAALVCDRDGRHVVPHSVWSSWPRARVQYVTVEHAAKMLGTTVAAVKMRASRGRWRRVGTGRDVRYLTEDVRAAAGVEGEVSVSGA